MDGFLDELERAFLTLEINQMPFDFEVETGFHGTLLIGEERLFHSVFFYFGYPFCPSGCGRGLWRGDPCERDHFHAG